MTFTDADHDKAVELYGRFGKAEWWPQAGGTLTPCKATTSGWCWAGGSGCYKAIWEPVEAMSAIAWAMVAHLYANGGCELAPEDPFGRGPVCYAYDNNAQGTPHYGATSFLALAAAVEGMESA